MLDPSAPADGAVFRVENLALNGAGGAHAAALSAILELAAYLALLPYLAADEHAVTHAANLQLQEVAPTGVRVEAHGYVDRRSTRLAFVSAVATVGSRVIARAQVVKSIVPMRTGPSPASRQRRPDLGPAEPAVRTGTIQVGRAPVDRGESDTSG